VLSNFIAKNKYFVFVLPFLIYFISFFNEWHLQDDHEIALFSEYMKNHSFLDTLRLTEVFQWGVFKRFRPTYYSLRIFESYIWGDNFFFWYLLRLCIQTFFLYEVYQWAKKKFDLTDSIVITLLMVSMLFWRDLQPRLGPGENYCVLGVALISYSLREKKNYFLYLIGGLLAIGSKENFVILPVVIAFLLLRMKQFKKIDFLYLTILSAFTFFIVLGLVLSMTSTGTDFYSRSVSPWERISTLLMGMITLQIAPYLALIFLYVRKKISLSKNEWTCLLLTSFVLLANIVFYNGKIPDGSRYDFPAIPLNLIAWVILYLKFDIQIQYKKYFYMLLGIVIISGIYRQEAKAIRRFKESRSFTKNMKEVFKNSNGGENILVVTDNPKDVELMLSVPRFFKAWGNKSNFYFKSQNLSASNLYQQDLAFILESMSKNGNGFDYLPLKENLSSCSQVNFHDSIDDVYCSRVTTFHQ
jgi:hypothetical protein